VIDSGQSGACFGWLELKNWRTKIEPLNWDGEAVCVSVVMCLESLRIAEIIHVLFAPSRL
jgi:hypothetical protein